jgi:hypothetical protein
MDCELVRDWMDEGGPEGAVAAHLAECAACRAEAGFARRVATAVATMSRVRAPEDLADRVMARVLPLPETARPARPHLGALRPWELGWVAALSVLLLALIPVGTPWWVPPDRSMPGSGSWMEWGAALWEQAGGGLSAAWGGWELSARSIWQSVAPGGAAGDAWSLTWVVGLGAFCLALHLLLAWRPGGAGGGVEDAHA